MTTFYIGCSGFTVPRERYITKLRAVEVDLRAPTPPPKALAQWRRAGGEGFTFSAVASATLYGERDWPLRDAAKVQSELDRFANQVDALGATAAVFRTPMAVSPGSVALKRFTAMIDRARRIAPRLVWDPAGLWQHDEAAALGRTLGVTVVSDPLHDEVTEPVVYARLRGLGADRRYTMSRLEALAEALEGVEEAYVIFDSPAAWREAVGFRKLVGELTASADEEFDDEDDDGEDDDGEDDGEGDDEDEDEG